MKISQKAREAALGSLYIPKIVAAVGWRNIIPIMMGLMLLGVSICVPYFVTRKRQSE